MIKIEVKKEDVLNAVRFLAKQPGAPLALHDPVAQALKRTFARDPRWRRPFVDVAFNEVYLNPRSKYSNVRDITIAIPGKIEKYCCNFRDKFYSGKSINHIGTTSFVIRGLSLEKGRVVVESANK